MLITESQLRTIINEEIEAMIEEGAIDEAFADAFRGLGRKLAGKAAQMTGLSSAELANQEKAAAASKAAGEEKAVTKQKEVAKKQIVQKIQGIINTVSKIERDAVDQIYELAKPLKYAGGKELNVEPLRKTADLFLKELEKIVDDIQGSSHDGAFAPTLKEKKAE